MKSTSCGMTFDPIKTDALSSWVSSRPFPQFVTISSGKWIISTIPLHIVKAICHENGSLKKLRVQNKEIINLLALCTKGFV